MVWDEIIQRGWDQENEKTTRYYRGISQIKQD